MGWSEPQPFFSWGIIRIGEEPAGWDIFGVLELRRKLTEEPGGASVLSLIPHISLRVHMLHEFWVVR